MNRPHRVYYRTTAKMIHSDVKLKVLQFRKYLTLPRSDMYLLYSMKINPMEMRNTIKMFLKTRLIAFKSFQSDWFAHAGYICSHIRDFIRDKSHEYVPEMASKRRLHNFLKRCKNLESLKIYSEYISPTVFRSMRYLYQLKSLHLVVNDDQMQESPNMARDLNRLRYVFIKVNRSWRNKIEKSPVSKLFFPRICRHLVKLQSLEKIELDLQELCNPDYVQVLESVLQHIGNSNIDFSIKLCLKNTVLNIENIKCTLEKTDSLVIECQQDPCYELRNHSRQGPNRSRITREGHRFLHFIFKGTEKSNFLPVIQVCSSLLTLWIEADLYLICMLGQFSFPETLKNLFVVGPYLSRKTAKIFISCCISALNDVETLETLFLSVLLEGSIDQLDRLKDLKCIRNSTKYDLTVHFVPGSSMTQLDETILTSLCSPIKTINSLKSLRLDFENSLVAPIECLQNMLDSLPKTLENFELVISAYPSTNFKGFDLYFPFEALGQLAEFRLNLCYPLSTEAGDQFTKGFVKMKELEVMVVKGACF